MLATLIGILSIIQEILLQNKYSSFAGIIKNLSQGKQSGVMQMMPSSHLLSYMDMFNWAQISIRCSLGCQETIHIIHPYL